jgi:oligoribonuclease
MTGLDPARHVVVEIATLLTDDDLTPIAEGPDIVIHATDAELEQMDDVVVAMHTRSGLLTEIKASSISLADAGEQTLAFLKAHIPEARTVPLCGNSIGTDRRFLAQYLPDIENFLHYRSIDVSTIKELCRRWYPDVLAAVPPKREAHRALGDIRESIAELAYYRSTIFIGGITTLALPSQELRAPAPRQGPTRPRRGRQRAARGSPDPAPPLSRRRTLSRR